jgi:hypothetical protein
MRYEQLPRIQPVQASAKRRKSPKAVGITLLWGNGFVTGISTQALSYVGECQ